MIRLYLPLPGAVRYGRGDGFTASSGAQLNGMTIDSWGLLDLMQQVLNKLARYLGSSFHSETHSLIQQPARS